MKHLALILAIAAVAVPCHGQYFSDDFESYSLGNGVPVGPGTYPVPTNGNWHGWDNNPVWEGLITTLQSVSGSQALEISNQVDAVMPMNLASGSGNAYPNFNPTPPVTWPANASNAPPGPGGQWRVSAWIYVPSSYPTGTADAYFIGQNAYNHNGPYDWFYQTKMSLLNSTIDDDMTPNTNGPAPLPLDVWFQLQIDMDMDNDCQSHYMDGVLMGTGPMAVPGWTNAGALPEFANIDLFSTGGTYYCDDLVVQTFGGPFYQANHPDASLDINGVQGSVCAPAITPVAQGGLANVNWASTLLLPYETVVTLGGIVPGNQAPGAITPGGQAFCLDLASPIVLFLNSTTPGVPNLIPFPAPGFTLPLIAPNAPATASAQFLILDPAGPPADQFRLSQAVQLDVP